MASQNTGYQGVRKLKKVVNGGPKDGQELDDLNKLCSKPPFNPNSKKDNNQGDPDYSPPVYKPDACPLPAI